MKKCTVFIVMLLFSNILLQAETGEHRSFVELGYVPPYGVHFGFGISYFYGGFNVLFNERESITLNKKYREYFLLADGSVDKNKGSKLLLEEEINSSGKSIWIQFPLGVQFDAIKKRNFTFSVREAWIPSIINVVYDNDLYRPDTVFDDKYVEVEKRITHLFWSDRGLTLLSDRTMYHAFYPLCFETTFQFVIYDFWTISLGAILDTGFIERSKFLLSFGVTNPFGFKRAREGAMQDTVPPPLIPE